MHETVVAQQQPMNPTNVIPVVKTKECGVIIYGPPVFLWPVPLSNALDV